MRIAGAHEFLGESAPEPAHLRRLAQAFARLDYDLVAVTPTEDEALGAAKADLSRQVFGAAPTLSLHTTPEGTLAIILFPAMPETDRRGDATFRMAQAARQKAGVVIGVSAWGADAEEAWLTAHPEALDILLGAGPGPGSGGLFVGNGATVWMRPYADGKTVGEIRIQKFPPAGTKATWRPGDNISATAIPLTHFVADDPEITAIVTAP
ncbi:hypothetical protein TDMWS_10930 [Thermodesulfomicrobium sp. WS]|uniref:UshA-like (seleno)protein family 2 n=1 Tax=Thermodesulfomicrobium sp. WS TaxID=3004129 RepID=UPI002493CF51|nr:hypothetical protein [Thermodesulfomicrobium sp. WS]BDV01008.1 hypothetical protein TDMWS_10930 [Thermodesulfomicrobium sp. WS]